MADKQEFIPGIYNYCDYICEKCVFTNRCYLFWSENDPEAAEEEMNMDPSALEDFIEDFGEDGLPGPGSFNPMEELEGRSTERRTHEIVAPAYDIIEILDPIMEKLAASERYPSAMTNAIELVLENYLLIPVKYYRAAHLISFDPLADVSERDIYRYLDSEKILMAIKAFLWNLRTGLTRLRKLMPGYHGSFTKALQLSHGIEERIDAEFLPAVRFILSRHSHYLDDGDTD
ncbi:MAG: hypothetical protein MAGBODY4_00605 [Candidatus Marinimicrobia bacterium]|nr:hypothetical protein [Candidatus Neomarinimicrobiota bacterium]